MYMVYEYENKMASHPEASKLDKSVGKSWEENTFDGALSR